MITKIAQLGFYALVVISVAYHLLPLSSAVGEAKKIADNKPFSVCDEDASFSYLSYDTPLNPLYTNVDANNYNTSGRYVNDNLISNPNLMNFNSDGTPTDWLPNSYGEIVAKQEFIRASDPYFFTQVSEVKEGDSKWSSNSIPVKAGEYYEFSANYRSDVTTKLIALVTRTDSSSYGLTIDQIEASEQWNLARSRFVIPTDAQSIRLAHSIDKVGFLATKSYSFFKVEGSNLAKPIVSVTFDDGWRSVYENARPLYQKYNIPTTQFIVGNYLQVDSFMNVNQIKQLQSENHEVGAHSLAHLDLTSFDSSTLHNDVTTTNYLLSRQFGPIKGFATPFGRYNNQVKEQILACQQYHRSTDSGYNSADFDPTNLKVQNVYISTTEAQIQSWVDLAKSNKYWLILVYHQVDNSDEYFNVTPAALERHFQIIKQSEVEVLTVSQALTDLTYSYRSQ